MPDPQEIVHIAGVDIQVGPHLRQRCSWCGAVLIDYENLDQIAVAITEEDPNPSTRPATWPTGKLVGVAGNAQWAVPHEDGDPIPATACARLDPAVTL